MRGQTSEVGQERTAPNGYLYVKTDDGWRLKHHVIAETVILRRKLLPNETVRFRDNDRTNLHPDNLLVAVRGDTNLKKRLSVIQERIRELKAEEAEIIKKLSSA